MKVKHALPLLAVFILQTADATAGPRSDHALMLGQRMSKDWNGGHTIYNTKVWIEWFLEKNHEDYDKRVGKRRSCEKWYGKLKKVIEKSPEKLWGKPTDRGNYPHPASIAIVGVQAHYLGLIRLSGCPDSTKVTQNLPEARKYFELAALQFNERSMYQLGVMIYKGLGGPRNESEGLAWINKAAAEWSVDAQDFLKAEGLPVPSPVSFQSKVLVADKTKGDNLNFDPNRRAAVKNTIATIAALAIGAYLIHEFTPSGVAFDPIIDPLQFAPQSDAAIPYNGASQPAPNDVCNCKGDTSYGGACYVGFGGPAYAGYGGPAYAGHGGPCYKGYGGPKYDGYGGPEYDGYGGPKYDGFGGPAYDGFGGPAYDGFGGPCYAGSGGPCYSGPGGTGENCPEVCK